MATVPAPATSNGYPTSSKKPMPETDWHRDLMLILIDVLRHWFASQQIYVSGNLLIFYEEGNRHRHVSPDIFVVPGVEDRLRPNYLLWEEGRSPQFVIELTSSSTRKTDQTTKRELYQDTLKVREYFLFDPDGDYLDPPLQGFRLHQGVYRPIRPLRRRLPSQVLGLHLERDERTLRLWNPGAQSWLLTPAEREQQAEQRAEYAERRAEQAEQRALALAEEVERIRRQAPPPPPG